MMSIWFESIDNNTGYNNIRVLIYIYNDIYISLTQQNFKFTWIPDCFKIFKQVSILLESNIKILCLGNGPDRLLGVRISLMTPPKKYKSFFHS